MAAGIACAQIPVTDAINIATQVTNQVESIAKWAQQAKQMQDQLNAMSGSRGMGGLLDNPAIRVGLPPDWQNVLASVRTSAAYATERQNYPTFTSRPRLNAMYDVVASQNVTMSDLYSKSNARLQQVQSLMGQIDSASDPAAKQDLTNRLINEQNAIQANLNLVTVLQTKQKQELEMVSQQAIKELSCKEFKRAGC